MEMIQPSERIKTLMLRRDRLHAEKRCLQWATRKGLIYFEPDAHAPLDPTWFSPLVPESEKICLGSHLCRVRVDYPFPGKIPSSEEGLTWDPVNWAEDYAYLLDNSPAEIYPDEHIVGEFHWMLEEFRSRSYPSQIGPLEHEVNQLGGGGTPFTHVCPDLDIGLSSGWKGIYEKISKHREKFELEGDEGKVRYLSAMGIVCNSIMRFIKKHADKARELAKIETNKARRENYSTIAEICDNISKNPPSNFYEAVQWIWFFVISDRIMGHANGYGRLDQVLYPFYCKEKEKGLKREEARNLIAELFMKYTGTYFSLGGRNKDLKDATNELSWICLEAYDMVGGQQTFGILWNNDIDRDFFSYACEVLARHCCGAPNLLNYDVMRQSVLNYGHREEDAWNVSYSGCHWYCVVGLEDSVHDTIIVWVIKCLLNALKTAFKNKVQSFQELLELYFREVDRTFRVLVDFLNLRFHFQPLIWPEIPTSLLMHRCIENGKDVTDCGAPYNVTSVNVGGLANVVDSLYAIRKLVVEEKKISLSELEKMLKTNYEGYEQLRQLLLDVPKFGNDEDDVDKMARMIVDQVRDVMMKYKSIKGTGFRPALMTFYSHSLAGPEFGPTPDGRKGDQTLAQGPNPMHGMSKKGVTATAKSIAKLGFESLAGGPFQLELDPSGKEVEELAKLIEAIVRSFFEMGGIQVNVNVVSVDTLKKAMEHPEEYGHIYVRVTGQTVRFVDLDRRIQEEIINRTRYKI